MSVITHRRIDLLLARYAQSHRHPLNEWIHCLCVPAIVLSLLGLLWAVAPVLAVVVGMLIMTGVMLLILSRLPTGMVLPVSAAIFVAAWIGQLIGHMIEGKKPTFFEDLRFLLIGPLFVLGLLYRRWHISY